MKKLAKSILSAACLLGASPVSANINCGAYVEDLMVSGYGDLLVHVELRNLGENTLEKDGPGVETWRLCSLEDSEAAGSNMTTAACNAVFTLLLEAKVTKTPVVFQFKDGYPVDQETNNQCDSVADWNVNLDAYLLSVRHWDS